MTKRAFTIEDQNNFAELSGDFNPLHVDELAARRYLFGTTVVHGVHLLLWALDLWARENQPFELTSLESFFRKPLPVGEDVEYRLKDHKDNSAELELAGNGVSYVYIKMSWKPKGMKTAVALPHALHGRACKVLNASQLTAAGGEFRLSWEPVSAVRLFPDLAKKVPSVQIAQILATTRLVGMECPGLNSLYSELSVSFESKLSEPLSLKYKVREFDSRFSRVKIDVEGPSMKGRIGAFLRPSPSRQESFTAIQKTVKSDEFADQSALIIGGSRGLGEVTAKLLAAGGAKVMLTYNKGRQDAVNIVNEIGEQAGCTYFDVMDLGKADLEKIAAFKPTHLYYFATPKISPSGAEFSEKLFKNFWEFYVSGFSRSLEFLLKAPSLKNIFYPSTVYIDHLPRSFLEYTKAKAEGEALCSDLEKKNKDLAVYYPRLPRMVTDQTVSIYSHELSGNPVTIMLEYLRHFQAKQKELVKK